MPTPIQTEYQQLRTALLNELQPENALEQVFAIEIVQAAWRLRQLDTLCQSDPAAQNEATDRARSRAHSILRRSTLELRRLQSERSLRSQLEKETEQPELPALASWKDVLSAKLLLRRLQGLEQFEAILRHADEKVAQDMENLRNTNQTHAKTMAA